MNERDVLAMMAEDPSTGIAPRTQFSPQRASWGQTSGAWEQNAAMHQSQEAFDGMDDGFGGGHDFYAQHSDLHQEPMHNSFMHPTQDFGGHPRGLLAQLPRGAGWSQDYSSQQQGEGWAQGQCGQGLPEGFTNQDQGWSHGFPNDYDHDQGWMQDGLPNQQGLSHEQFHQDNQEEFGTTSHFFDDRNDDSGMDAFFDD